MYLRDLGRLEVYRTTIFRFTSVACAVSGIGVVALLGLVYQQTATDLNAGNDRLVRLEIASLLPSTPEALPRRIAQREALNVSRNTRAALFSHDGAFVAGDIASLPPELKIDGQPGEIAATLNQPPLRAQAVSTAWGEIVVVGRDSGPLRQVRAILLHTLIASGAVIATAGLGAASLLSLSPLRRLRELEGAGRRIAAGGLHLRMPVSRRRDELDLFAGTVNAMMAEIERLIGEVKSTTDAAAHDLRTPLTRVRAQLHRLAHASATPSSVRDALEQVIADLDDVLDRFAALLRISELEGQERRAGFGPVDLAVVVSEAAELYEPLAEAEGVRLVAAVEPPTEAVEADGRLLFEAVSNLLDNAIKFSPVGGEVVLSLRATREGPEIGVRDAGPGVEFWEREAVLQRFYRGARAAQAPGHGLGLSLVAAIARLHRFELRLDDARPGLQAVLVCTPHL